MAHEPYIQMRKKLRHDPRVVALAAKLQRSKAEIIGGLFLLWCLGDEHGEVLRGMTKPLLDIEIGIPGFSDALPSEWLQERVTRRNGNAEAALHLPNYAGHNESTEKSRSLNRARVRRFRERQKDDCNAITALHDSPDQPSPTQTRREEIKPPTTADLSAIAGYGREVLGLDLRRLGLAEILSDFGSVAVVEAVEHLASRRASERMKGIRNQTGFLKSLCQKAEQGPLAREHDYESFMAWKSRADARVMSQAGKVAQ